MLKKIVVIGPESTGKSTLSEALAKQLNTVWVPEYARDYLENQKGQYQYDDLLKIALGQMALEDKAVAKAQQYLICDTDLNVLKVWSEHKYGRTHPSILHSIATRKYDGYILCNIDMPWQPDPLREHPDESMRRYFFAVYKDIVVHSGRPFVLVQGDEDDRLRQALKAAWWSGTMTNEAE